MTAVLLGAALLGATCVTPAHRHPATSTHGAVVHRHASPHLLGRADQPTLATDDGRILWIHSTWLPGKVIKAPVVPHDALPGAPPPLAALCRSGGIRPLLASERTHDPPWRVSGSRAPPITASL
jgi:hypothetical protein